MLRLAADEDFDGRLVRVLRRVCPDLDIARVQDAHLHGAPDRQILEWAADAGRILLTHDSNTLVAEAWQRVNLGLPMPGVMVVKQGLPPGQIIAELALLATASDEGEWGGQVLFISVH